MAEDILSLFNNAAGQVQGSGQQLSSGLGDLQSGLANQIASQAAGYAPSQALQQVSMVPQAAAQRAQQSALERSNLLAQALQAQAPIAQNNSDMLAQWAQQQMQTQLQGEDQIAGMRKSAAMSSAAADRNIGRAREAKSAASSGLEGLTPYQLFGVQKEANTLRSKLIESYLTGRRGGKFYQEQVNELGAKEYVPVSGKKYVQDLASSFEPLFNTYGLDRKDVVSMIRQAGKQFDESDALNPQPLVADSEQDTGLGESLMKGAGWGAGAGVAGRIGAHQLGQRVPQAAKLGAWLSTSAPKTPAMAAAGAVLAPTFTSGSAQTLEEIDAQEDERQRRRAEMSILQRLADSLGL